MTRLLVVSVWFLTGFIPVICQLADIRSACPRDWIYNSGSCYKLNFHSETSYESAKLLCGDQHHSNLISIGSMSEAEYISKLLSDRDVSQSIWLTSGYKQSDNNWVWQGDGTNISINYWHNYADPVTADVGNLIAFKKVDNQFKWKSISANTVGSYICEVKSSQIKPSIWSYQSQGYGVLDFTKVQFAPKIVVQSPPAIYHSEVQNVAQITLNCNAVDSETLKYEWFKDSGIKLNIVQTKKFSLVNGDLVITNVTGKDYGSYYCLVSNAAGSVRSLPVALIPAYVRKFPNTRSDVFAVEGLGKSVACEEPRHSPTNLGYTWMYEGVTNFMRDTENVFLSRDGTLYYSYVNKTDEKRLACSIISPSVQSGQYGPFFKLKVEKENGNPVKSFKPFFPTEFPKIYPSQLELNESAVFECFAYGRPTPKYKWERKNTNLPIAGEIDSFNRKILFKKFKQSDTGVYSCTAYNSVGSTSVDFHLSVTMKPVLLESMKDQFAHVSDSVSFDCFTYAIPNADIEWFKDGVPINPLVLSEFDSQRIRMQKHRLTISKTVQNDAGVYQCFATNPSGQISASAQLSIKELPVTFDKSPRNQIIFAPVGQKTKLSCQPQCSPVTIVSWTHNTQTVAEDKRVKLSENGNILEFTNVTQLDDGHYNCYAANIHGSSSYTQTVKVTRKYSIGMQPKLLAIDIGSQLTLKCPVVPHDDCGFESAVNWKFNDIPVRQLPQFQDSKMVKDRLMIKSVTKAHQGVYLCSALTPSGVVASSTVISINGPPLAPIAVEIEQLGPFDVKVWWKIAERSKVTLTYKYRIEAATFVRSKNTWSDWQTVTECVKPEPVKDQVVSDLQPFSLYKFRIVAGYHLGWSLPSVESRPVEIQKFKPTEFPKHLRSVSGKRSEIRLNWESLNEKYWNDANISYIVQWRNVSDNSWNNLWVNNPLAYSTSFLVPKSNVSCLKYAVRVAVRNSQGTGPHSPIIEVYSNLAVINVSPTISDIEVLNSSAVNISWKFDSFALRESCSSKFAYRISYGKVSEPNHWAQHVNIFCADRTNSILSGLPVGATLTFKIAAFNSAGLGPYSQHVVVATTKNAPKGMPSQLEIIQGKPDKNSISVSWHRLETDSSEETLIGYKVHLYRGATTQPQIFSIGANRLSSGQPQIQISGLDPAKRYGIQLLGYSRGGDGPPTKRLDFVFAPHSRGTQLISTRLWAVLLSAVLVVIGR